jgi:hypothetical protein
MAKLKDRQPLFEAAPAARSTPCLAALRRLLDQLEQQGIGYCHWKSNEHLEAAMVGATDLDVLVDRSRSYGLQRILGATGFKRFEPTRPNSYPAMEDYLGFDDETGLEEIQRRVETVRALRFGRGVKTEHINADEPLEQVLLQAKRLIWAQI